MKVLVINCGSSSIKYQLFDMNDEKVLAKGLVERIGMEGSVLTHKVNDKKYEIREPIKDHRYGVKLVIEALTDKEYGVIESMDEIAGVGHRVVHGGEKYSESVLVDENVINYIGECIELAPLHNHANLVGIKACLDIMPNTPMVVVFDTAFHVNMPKENYIYPIPYEYYEKYGIRRYGFHGTSHKYISNRACEFLGEDIKNLKIITCHLGNGASVTAIKDGHSINTSMGFTPLEGLCMGTRTGDVDLSIFTYLMKKENLTYKDVDIIANKKSGLLGIYGKSSDFRDVRDDKVAGEERAVLAYKIFGNRIKGYIGNYAAQMNGVDLIVFSGGIGENDPSIREYVCESLAFLGVDFDKEANEEGGEIKVITKKGSKVRAMIVTTDEELMIARDTKTIITK